MENIISMTTVSNSPTGGSKSENRIWKWIVVIGSNVAIMLCAGLPPTMGAVLSVLAEVFDESVADTSWVISLAISMVSFCGPVASALSNKHGIRQVVAFGAFLSTLGMFLSSYATSLSFLYISYGLVTGIGFGLAFTPSISILGLYFTERFALANALAFTGASAGLFVFPPLLHFLTEHFGWKSTFMILSGISANLFVSAAIFRPVDAIPRRRHQPSNVFSIAYGLSIPPTLLNMGFPTILDMATEADVTQCVVSPNVVDSFKAVLNGKQVSKLNGEKVRALTDGDQVSISVTETNPNGNAPSSKVDLIGTPNNPSRHGNDLCSVQQPIPYLYEGKFCNLMESEALASMVRAASGLFTGNILPHDNQDIVKSLRNMRFTLEATNNGHVREQYEPARSIESKPKSWLKFLDWTLFRTKPLFLGLSISFFLIGIGYNSSLIYLVAKATDNGISPSDAAFLASIVGIFNVIGQLGHAWFLQMKLVTGSQAYHASLAVCGVTSLFSVLMTSQVTYGIYCGILGLCSGVFMTVIVVVCKEYVGEEKLPDAIGLSLPPFGIGGLLGPPLSGWLFDNGNYNGPIFLSGATFLLAAMCVFLELFKCRCLFHKNVDSYDSKPITTAAEHAMNNDDDKIDFIYINAAYLNNEVIPETAL